VVQTVCARRFCARVTRGRPALRESRASPLWTDRVAARAILDHLLSNAVKFSPRGKRIWGHVQGDGPSAICRV